MRNVKAYLLADLFLMAAALTLLPMAAAALNMFHFRDKEEARRFLGFWIVVEVTLALALALALFFDDFI